MYSTGEALLVISILFPILSTIAVALRFRARALKQVPIGSDGWVVLFSLLCAYITNFLMSYAFYHNGFNVPQEKIPPPLKEKFELIIFIITLAWPFTISIVKVSVILLYRRIFIIPWFHKASNILIGVTLAWMIASVLAPVFAWTPISGQWTRIGTININYPAFLIATQVLSVTLDIVTLALPLAVIRTLNMTTKKKLIISSIFLLGILCLVGGIVRLVYFIIYLQSVGAISGSEKANAYKINTIPLLILWGLVEVDIGIIASCLPTYAPLLHDRAIESVIRSARSALSLRTLSSGASKRSRAQHTHDDATQGWLELNGDGNNATLVESGKMEKRHSNSSGSLQGAREGIMVNTDVSVATMPRQAGAEYV